MDASFLYWFFCPFTYPPTVACISYMILSSYLYCMWLYNVLFPFCPISISYMYKVFHVWRRRVLCIRTRFSFPPTSWVRETRGGCVMRMEYGRRSLVSGSGLVCNFATLGFAFGLSVVPLADWWRPVVWLPAGANQRRAGCTLADKSGSRKSCQI